MASWGCAPPALLCWLLLVCSSHALEPDSELSLVMFPEELADALGAWCMDGSRGGYYFLDAASAANASKLVIYIEGGGECRTREACNMWSRRKGSSTYWGWTKRLQPYSTMSTNASENPDFHDWAKVFIPYCSGDMHAGTRRDADHSLGSWIFAGHNLIEAVVAQLKAAKASPSHILLTGSSAGGIATITHVDYFKEKFPNTAVKGAVECGFFYADVTSYPNFLLNRTTDVSSLGFLPAWKPYLPSKCAAETGGDLSTCTNAHTLYPHITSPLFFMENQYDTAKLANCGLRAETATSAADVAYLRAWGEQVRRQWKTLKTGDGVYSASCANHGDNFRFDRSPVVKGRFIQDALSNWFFDKGDLGLLKTVDDCGDVPCTPVSKWQVCNKAPWPSLTPSGSCNLQLAQACPQRMGMGQACKKCLHDHAARLIAAGCTRDGAAMMRWYCGTSRAVTGRHVCDLSGEKDDGDFQALVV